jgi:hypothetical protein
MQTKFYLILLMKLSPIKCIWIAALLLGLQQVHTGLFDWSATLWAEHEGRSYNQTVTAGTFIGCQLG